MVPAAETAPEVTAPEVPAPPVVPPAPEVTDPPAATPSPEPAAVEPGARGGWGWLTWLGGGLGAAGLLAALRWRTPGLAVAGAGAVALTAGVTGSLGAVAALGAGVVVGLVIGVFGAGGALVTVPALIYLFGQSAHHAAAGSLVIVGAAALINSLHGLLKRTVDWRTGVLVGAAGFLPAIAGGVLAAHAGQNVLQLGLAVLMGLASAKMLRDAPAAGSATAVTVTGRARLVRVLLIGTGAGLLTGLLGIGGAFLVIPALVMAKVADLRTATATVVLVTAINSVAGLLARTGDLPALDWALIAPFAGAAVLAGLVGKRLKDALPTHRLQRGFAGLLVLVAGFTTFTALSTFAGPVVAVGVTAGGLAMFAAATWGGGRAVASVLARLRGLTPGARRERKWEQRLEAWTAIGAAPLPGRGEPVTVDMVWRLVTAAHESGSGGVTVRHVRRGSAGRGGEAWQADLAAHLAGGRHHREVVRLLAALVAAGLVEVQRPDTGGAVHRPVPALTSLLARGPPELVAALLRNPAAVLGRTPGSAVELADAVFAVLRGAIWDRAALRPGWRSRLPGWLRGGRAGAKALFADVRPVSQEVDRIAATLRAPRQHLAAAVDLADAAAARDEAQQRLAAAGAAERAAARRALQKAERAHERLTRKLPPHLRDVAPDGRVAAARAAVGEIERAMAAAQETERLAVHEASNAAVLAGHTRKDVVPVRDAAVLGWTRFMAPLAGLMGAFPGQAAGAPAVASADFAAYYGQTPAWVTGQSAIGTTAASGVGLTAALLGDRLIKNMVTVVAMGAAGSAALLVLGMVPAAVVFLPSVFVVGSMGVAGGLVRGRMDRYHPVARELKDGRDARYETAFKATQFVLPVAIGQGMVVVGFQVTMLGLAVLAGVLTAAIWVVMRGEGRGAQPRAPPAVWSAVVGGLRQFVGTPLGLLRAAMSIPLLTALTGLSATALGGTMIDQLVLLNDPTQSAFGTTAIAVSVLVTVRGLATMFTGAMWPKLKALLGRPGAIAKKLGRDVEVGPLSEARVLRGVTLLPVVLAVPAVWLVLTPGLMPFGVLLTFGAVLAAWARMPLNRWVEGATGASLNNTAKAATIALGAAISSAFLGPYPAEVTERVAAGLPYADVVAAGNLRLALLVIPVVVIPALVAHFIGKLRVATLDDLAQAMETAGVTQEAAKGITGKLASRGLNDVGSARALFLSPGWRPWFGAGWRLAARTARQGSVDLTPQEREWLVAALETFGPSGRGLRPRAARALVLLRSARTVVLRWLRLAGFTVLLAGGMTVVAALVHPDSAAAARTARLRWRRAVGRRRRNCDGCRGRPGPGSGRHRAAHGGAGHRARVRGRPGRAQGVAARHR